MAQGILVLIGSVAFIAVYLGINVVRFLFSVIRALFDGRRNLP